MMIDRFQTEDAQTVTDACEALRDGTEFQTTVHRPQCSPEHQTQHWVGAVLRISRHGDLFEIEVAREDLD